MHRPLTDTVSIQQMLDMRESGMSNAEISNSLGVTPAVIRKYIGVQAKNEGKYRRWTDAEIEEMRRMREAGMTVVEICEKTGIPEATFYRRLGKASGKGGVISKTIPLPKKSKAPSDEPPACLVMQNKTYELHGLCGSYVIDIKKKEITVETVNEDNETQIDSFTFEGLEEVINRNLDRIRHINDQNAELLAIKRKMKELVVGGEMW